MNLPRQYRSWSTPTLALTALLAAASTGCFDDGAPEVAVLASGLRSPTDLLALSDGRLLVAESGAARVVTIDPTGNASTLIAGFSLGTFFPYDIGPLSLATLVDGTILVGEGGRSTNQERIAFFDPTGLELPDSVLVPVRGSNFAALAIDPITADLYAASAGTNVIHRASPVGEGGFGDPVEFIPDTTAAPIELDAPAGLAFEPTGDLIVSFAGFHGSGIVRITTDPEAGTVLVDRIYETDEVVTDVAVRPSDAAIFFTEASVTSGVLGTGRLARMIRESEGTDGLTATSVVADLAAPSALAFDANDALFVATLGRSPNTDTGEVLTITFFVADAPTEPVAAPTDTSAETTQP